MKYGDFKDDYLLQLLKTGDEVAFREIYLRYWKRLYASAYGKIKSRDLAEEVVQQIFVRLWEKREESEIENLPCYLQTAVKYAFIGIYREKLADGRYQEHAKAFQNQTDCSTEKEIALQELTAAIQTGVELMPVKTQQIFTLNRLQNQSVPQIAKNLKMPSRTIEYHITQGVRFLRMHLKDFVSFCLVALPVIS